MQAETRSVRSIEPVLAELAGSMRTYEDLKEHLLSKLKFTPVHEIKPGTGGSPGFAAVDSSSAIVVDAGCFMIIAHRAGHMLSRNGRLIDPHRFTEIPFELALVNTSELAVEKNFHSFLRPLMAAMAGGRDVTDDMIPPLRQMRPRDIDWLQLVRTVSEWREVRMLLDELEPGDYILHDGALRADIRVPPSVVEDILKLAAERQIHVVGLVKRSSIPVGPNQLMPVVPAVQKLGAAELPGQAWFSPLPLDERIDDYPYNYGRSYIVQYHPVSQFVFWTDLNRFDSLTPDKAFGRISTLCSDPVYPGYPYPLAYIHNNVIVTRSNIEDIKYDLQSSALESNTLTPGSWELLFGNFHDILDINLY